MRRPQKRQGRKVTMQVPRPARLVTQSSKGHLISSCSRPCRPRSPEQDRACRQQASAWLKHSVLAFNVGFSQWTLDCTCTCVFTVMGVPCGCTCTCCNCCMAAPCSIWRPTATEQNGKMRETHDEKAAFAKNLTRECRRVWLWHECTERVEDIQAANGN